MLFYLSHASEDEVCDRQKQPEHIFPKNTYANYGQNNTENDSMQ